MTWAKLDLELPTGTWLADASMAAPNITFRLVAATTTGDEAVLVIECAGNTTEITIEAIADHATVREVVDIGHNGETHVLHVSVDVPSFLRAADRADCPFGFPILVRNGTATVDVVASHEHVTALDRELRRVDVGVGVRSVGQDPTGPSLLTHGQAGLVDAALEKGYYDTPRRCTLSELAESQGIAKSTCSEVLHRAEGRMVRAIADETNGSRATATLRSSPPN